MFNTVYYYRLTIIEIDWQTFKMHYPRGHHDNTQLQWPAATYRTAERTTLKYKIIMYDVEKY